MRSNRGNTNLRIRRRKLNSFQEFDLLPEKLRKWLRNVVLPWSARFVSRVYQRVITTTGNVSFFIAELERFQELQLVKAEQKGHSNGCILHYFS